MPAHHTVPLLAIGDEALSATDLVRDQQLWAVPATTPAGLAHAQLTTLGYSVAPLTDVPITRFVRRDDLPVDGTRPVDEFASPIDEAAVRPESSPLSEVLEVLRHHAFVFTRYRDHITGIVTRADLEQPVVGLLVLGMILATESALDHLIARTAGETWVEQLSQERAARLEEVYEQRRRADADLDPLRCLNLDDRLTLARKLGLAAELGLASNKELRDWNTEVSRVRDHLAHGDTLLSAVPDPGEALAAVARLRATTEAAWASARSGAPER